MFFPSAMYQQPQRRTNRCNVRSNQPVQPKQLFAKVRIGGDMIMLNALVSLQQFKQNIVKRISAQHGVELSVYYLDGRDWVTVVIDEDWDVMKVRAVAQGVDTISVKVAAKQVKRAPRRRAVTQRRMADSRESVQQLFFPLGLNMLKTAMVGSKGTEDAVSKAHADTEHNGSEEELTTAVLSGLMSLFGIPVQPQNAEQGDNDKDQPEDKDRSGDQGHTKDENANVDDAHPRKDESDEDYDDLEALEEPSKDEDEVLTAPYEDEPVQIVDVCIDPVSGEECHDYSTNQEKDDPVEHDDSSDSVVEQISSDSDPQLVDVNDNTPILVALGFDENAARTALEKTGGNLNAAADMLFNMQNYY